MRERKNHRAPIAVGPFRKPTKQHVFAHNSNTVYCVYKKVWLAIARRIIGTRAHHHTQLDCCRITRLAEFSTHIHAHTNTHSNIRTRTSLIIDTESVIQYEFRQSLKFFTMFATKFNSIKTQKKKLNTILLCLFSNKQKLHSTHFSNRMFNETYGKVSKLYQNETGLSIFTSNSPKKTVRKIV